MRFNLLTEPWIPVLTLTGEYTHVGVRDALVRAGEHRLAGDTDWQTVALLRLLLAVTYRAVHLSAIMGRHQFTSTPGPVIDELIAVAGGRDDILLPEVSRWVGFYEDQFTARLAAALRDRFELLDEHVQLGRTRRDTPPHSSQSFHRD